jgi:transposase
MVKLIDTISTGVPNALVEVTTLGRTLKKRAADVLAYFDRPGTSNGPTEAINGRLEHLRGRPVCGVRRFFETNRGVESASSTAGAG